MYGIIFNNVFSTKFLPQNYSESYLLAHLQIGDFLKREMKS